MIWSDWGWAQLYIALELGWHSSGLELQTIHRFSQSRRRPLVIVKTDGSWSSSPDECQPAPEQCTVLLSLSQIRSWSWHGHKGNIFTILLYFKQLAEDLQSMSMNKRNIEKYRDLKIYLQSMWSDWPLLCSMLFDNLFVNIQRYKGSTSFDLFI